MAAKTSYIDRMEYFIQHYSTQLTLHEIRLFLCLFHLNNKARWAEWFECDNVSLALMLRLPERNLIRAKNGLKEKGLIDFQPGKKGKPSKYRLMELGGNIPLLNCTVQNDREIHNCTVQNDSDSDSVSDSETPGKSQAPRGLADPLRNKDIKTIYTPLPPKGGEDGLFSKFWDAYPKQKSRQQAEKAWGKIKPSPELLERMMAALEAQKQTDDWQKDGGRFIPYPAKWLKDARWEDVLEPASEPTQEAKAAYIRREAEKQRILAERDRQAYLKKRGD